MSKSDVIKTPKEITWTELVPIRTANEINEKELSMCFHYTNHQPLFADANLHKSNKWSKEEELYWRENIIDKSLL
jgi:hypothetical protein